LRFVRKKRDQVGLLTGLKEGVEMANSQTRDEVTAFSDALAVLGAFLGLAVGLFFAAKATNSALVFHGFLFAGASISAGWAVFLSLTRPAK